MANHVTQAARDDLRRKAEWYTHLDSDWRVIDFDDSACALADTAGVSLQRARAAISYVARRRRAPDYEPRGPGRPAVMQDGDAVTIYLSAAHAARAAELGNGNVSAGVRYALDACLF